MSNRRRSHPSHTHAYSEEQLAGLHAYAAQQKQTTIDRLHDAIDALKAKKQETMPSVV